MAAPARATCSREKEVKITVDATGKITVSPDRFHVSKSGNEEVVWTCNVAFDSGLRGIAILRYPIH